MLNWQGSQIPLIAFDELTHFTQKQFWYMVSRNRSMCGVRPYIRATCNPDADSWVAELIAWWINQDTGYPIPERSGVLRWFIRIGDSIVWADRPEDLAEYRAPNEHGELVPIPPKSLTFIPAKLSDNVALMRADPGYLANLMALPLVERERLLGGNWKIRAAAGLLFRRGWCQVVDAIPEGTQFVRGWDLAATPKTESNDPDWTVGTKIGRMPDGRFIVAHSVRIRKSPAEVERLLAQHRVTGWPRLQDRAASGPGAGWQGAGSKSAQAAGRLPRALCAGIRRQGDPLRRVLRPGRGRQRGGAARAVE